MRKIFYITALIVLATLCLCACGGDVEQVVTTEDYDITVTSTDEDVLAYAFAAINGNDSSTVNDTKEFEDEAAAWIEQEYALLNGSPAIDRSVRFVDGAILVSEVTDEKLAVDPEVGEILDFGETRQYWADKEESEEITQSVIDAGLVDDAGEPIPFVVAIRDTDGNLRHIIIAGCSVESIVDDIVSEY